MTVVIKRLGTVCDIIAGQHIPAAEHNNSGQGTPYLTGPADFGIDRPIISKWTDNPRQYARSTDVLVTVKGAGVGKTNYGIDATIGRQLMALRPHPNILDQRYLFHWIRRNERALNRLGQGSTIPGIGKTELDSLSIPLPCVTERLPCLTEQRRIADILDKADAIQRKRKEAIALTDELLRSAFLEMFGDPVQNPKKLRRMSLGNLIELKSGNFLPSKAMDNRGTYAVYGGNGANGRHTAYMFEEPVVVIGRVGMYCGAVHRTEPRSWVTDNALYVSHVVPELRSTYLEHALRTANLNQYANQAAQPLISAGRIFPVEILVPPVDVQERYASLCDVHGRLAASYLKAGEECDRLFASIEQRAFRGELTRSRECTGRQLDLFAGKGA